ncbi:MAG: biopolymer transporter ExbD [Hahellaceae bacterium]|nr:biopolymer transporter ExbD [Hahellaceae bacterium]
MLLESGTTAKRRAISLTPLIDVVFILLLFFMLSSSFSRERQFEVALPSPGVAGETESQIIHLLDNEGNLEVAGAHWHWSAATPLRQLAETPSRRYIVMAAPEVKTQALVTLADRLRRAGVQRVSLVPPAPRGR